jgi:protocatechuate 3,4-dioxygenase alpha subunit
VTAATAFQTIGPFWHLVEDKAMADLTRFGATGERVTLLGTLRDGDGAVCPDACIEIWQPSPAPDDHFPGYGRCNTDRTGSFRFTTLKPGPVAGNGNALQAPHIAINILSRGVMSRLYTRAYFAGDPHNDADPLLNLVPPSRRATMIAREESPATWRLDLRLQGEGETVFIAL